MPAKALLEAVNANNSEEIQRLLAENSTLLNESHYEDRTILYVACSEQCVTIEIIDLLLQLGSDVNIICGDDQMVGIHYAAIGGNPIILQKILQKANQTNTNINAKTINGDTAMHILCSHHFTSNDFSNFTQCLQHLLEAGVDKTMKNKYNKTAFDITMAAKPQSFFNCQLIVELFLRHDSLYSHIEEAPGYIDAVTSYGYTMETVFEWAIRMKIKSLVLEMLKRIDYEPTLVDMFCVACTRNLEMVQTFSTASVGGLANMMDSKGKFPLYYGGRMGGKEITLQLLSSHACLANKNSDGTLSVSDVNLITLEEHFDKSVEQRDDDLIFDYKNIMPLQKPCANFKSTDVHEWEVIGFISKSPELNSLMAHSLIETYVLLKWRAFLNIFYLNFTFYSIFYLSLLLFVYNFNSNIALCVFLSLTTSILSLREIFQITTSGWGYFHKFENIMEIVLLIATIRIIVVDSSISFRSLTLLLAAFELLYMMGHYPKCSAYVIMFQTVAVKIIKIFLFYSPIIFTFAMCFYLLLHESNESFATPYLSGFKIIFMLTGEFEVGDIQFRNYGSYAIVLLFGFISSIVLFNLIIGMAISDINEIKKDARVLVNISCFNYITNCEYMIFNNKFILKMLCLLYRLHSNQFVEYYKFGKYLDDYVKLHINLKGLCVKINGKDTDIVLKETTVRRMQLMTVHSVEQLKAFIISNDKQRVVDESIEKIKHIEKMVGAYGLEFEKKIEQLDQNLGVLVERVKHLET